MILRCQLWKSSRFAGLVLAGELDGFHDALPGFVGGDEILQAGAEEAAQGL